MKKILMVAALAATSIVAAQAQSEFKPKAGDVTTDVSLFANGLFANPTALYKGNVASGVSSNKFDLSTVGVLKGRYFFQDDLALRLSLGLSSPSVKSTLEETNHSLENKYRATTLYFGLGVEKHFTGTDRLSPYVGAELHVGSYTTNAESNDTRTVGTIVTKTNQQIKAAPGFTFGGGLFMGADYYIAPKVFLGLEAGLNIDAYSLGKTTNITTINVTGQPTQTTDNSGKTKFSGSSLSTDLQVGFKIGFVF
nr:BT1926 family outer membrane beta-barrel protein [uncultured Porphyromonas sp.]